MIIIEKKAFAKINLTLEILGKKRGDGFHDMASVMHKIDLCDTVTVTWDDAFEGITLNCDADVCAPEENLAFRAAKAYYDAIGKTANLKIDLVKRIPFGAGLAGGSADAAAVLDAVNEKEKALSLAELSAIAASLGSDIPFCLEAHTCAMCTGRGEIVTDLPTPDLSGRVVVKKPTMSLSTKGIYAAYDEKYGEDYTKDRTERMAQRIRKGAELKEILALMCNDFQPLCEERCPEIADLVAEMRKQGMLSQMSGSGSAVFGIRL